MLSTVTSRGRLTESIDLSGRQTYSDGRYEEALRLAKPSDFIACITSLPPGPVVIYCRVSTRAQRKHLVDQEKKLRGHLTKLGFNVLKAFEEVVPGSEMDAGFRNELVSAAKFAKDNGAVVVAESGFRFMRSNYERNAVPAIYEMNKLMALVNGAQLATLHSPDTHWKAVRSEETKRGHAVTGRYGGRGNKRPAKTGSIKRRREEMMEEVLELWRDGLSLRLIERWMETVCKVSFSTLRDWINREKSQKTAQL